MPHLRCKAILPLCHPSRWMPSMHVPIFLHFCLTQDVHWHFFHAKNHSTVAMFPTKSPYKTIFIHWKGVRVSLRVRALLLPKHNEGTEQFCHILLKNRFLAILHLAEVCKYSWYTLMRENSFSFFLSTCSNVMGLINLICYPQKGSNWDR